MKSIAFHKGTIFIKYENGGKLNQKLSLCLQMLKMSTGHMEGDLQPLYLLLTDFYIYLLRKGNHS